MLTIADKLYIDSNGNIGIGTSPTASLDFSIRTDGIVVPRGTTAQRPSIAYNGMMRFNIDASINTVEMYINNGWRTASSSRPAITGVAQTSLRDSVVVGVNGSFFESDQLWTLIGKDGRLYYPTVVFNNSSYVTIQAPVDLSTNNVPYVIKVHSKRSGLEFISPTIWFDLSPVAYSAPVITSSVPADISQNVSSTSYSVSYTFTATGGNITWSINSTSYGTINAVTGVAQVTFQALTADVGVFTVTASNGIAPNATQSWNYNVKSAPNITSSQPANIAQNTTSSSYVVSYTFTATGTAPITWSINTATYGNINSSTGALTLTFPVGTSASGTFVVTVTNSLGSATKSWTYNTVVSPTITSSQPVDISQSLVSSPYTQSYTFTATGTTPITWSINNTTYGNINSSTGALTLTFPVGTTASGTFTVTASNGASPNATQSWTYSIQTLYAPTIADPAPADFEGALDRWISSYYGAYSFTYNMSASGTTPITWSVSPTTYASINSSGVLTFSFPNQTAVSQDYTVTASNAAGASPKTWKMTSTNNQYMFDTGVIGPFNGTSQILKDTLSGINPIGNRYSIATIPSTVNTLKVELYIQSFTYNSAVYNASIPDKLLLNVRDYQGSKWLLNAQVPFPGTTLPTTITYNITANLANLAQPREINLSTSSIGFTSSTNIVIRVRVYGTTT